jgi:hypothetical protein
VGREGFPFELERELYLALDCLRGEVLLIDLGKPLTGLLSGVAKTRLRIPTRSHGGKLISYGFLFVG